MTMNNQISKNDVGWFSGRLQTLVLLVAVLMIGFSSNVENYYYRTAYPNGYWDRAELEPFKNSRGEVAFMYGSWPQVTTSAFWIVSIFDEHGRRIATRKADRKWTYKPNTRAAKEWSWSAIFENGVDIPEVPDVPFFTCLYYEGSPRDLLHAVKTTSPFCSQIFDPNSQPKRKLK